MTPEQILEEIKEAVNSHEPDSGFTQWYVDEFSIDCEAEELWKVVRDKIKEIFTVRRTEELLAKKTEDVQQP
jgi:hypothetical protein